MRKSSVLFGAALILMTIGNTAQADEKAIAKGEKLFKRCVACHVKGPIGPKLTNIIGRKAASEAGFKYSDALKAKAAEGLVWNEENLSKFLIKPKGFIPGTNMNFPGLRKEKKVKQILSYLKSVQTEEKKAEAPAAAE